MSERPIEEIIGWSRVHDRDVPTGGWWTPSMDHPVGGRAVTVDNLLTWLLDDSPAWIYINNVFDDEGNAREWQVRRLRHEASGRSLFAALEALVREVAAHGR